MQTYYTTRGAVRGACGHHHRTLGAAQRCADADQRDCARAVRGSFAHGYSDRRVVAVDNDGWRELDGGERWALLSPEERDEEDRLDAERVEDECRSADDVWEDVFGDA